MERGNDFIKPLKEEKAMSAVFICITLCIVRFELCTFYSSYKDG